jgi:hypothetical protein
VGRTVVCTVRPQLRPRPVSYTTLAVSSTQASLPNVPPNSSALAGHSAVKYGGWVRWRGGSASCWVREGGRSRGGTSRGGRPRWRRTGGVAA